MGAKTQTYESDRISSRHRDRCLNDPAEDARMGHIRLDEWTGLLSGCPPGSLYDRISFVLQRAGDENAELRKTVQMVEHFISHYRIQTR